MRPVTALCSHYPPTPSDISRCTVGTRSPEPSPLPTAWRSSPRAWLLPPAHSNDQPPLPRRGVHHSTTRPFKGGRSAARRVVNVGMPVHPRKRAKHGRRVIHNFLVSRLKPKSNRLLFRVVRRPLNTLHMRIRKKDCRIERMKDFIFSRESHSKLGSKSQKFFLNFSHQQDLLLSIEYFQNYSLPIHQESFYLIFLIQ